MDSFGFVIDESLSKKCVSTGHGDHMGISVRQQGIARPDLTSPISIFINYSSMINSKSTRIHRIHISRCSSSVVRNCSLTSQTTTLGFFQRLQLPCPADGDDFGHRPSSIAETALNHDESCSLFFVLLSLSLSLSLSLALSGADTSFYG